MKIWLRKACGAILKGSNPDWTNHAQHSDKRIVHCKCNYRVLVCGLREGGYGDRRGKKSGESGSLVSHNKMTMPDCERKCC